MTLTPDQVTAIKAALARLPNTSLPDQKITVTAQDLATLNLFADYYGSLPGEPNGQGGTQPSPQQVMVNHFAPKKVTFPVQDWDLASFKQIASACMNNPPSS